MSGGAVGRFSDAIKTWSLAAIAVTMVVTINMREEGFWTALLVQGIWLVAAELAAMALALLLGAAIYGALGPKSRRADVAAVVIVILMRAGEHGVLFWAAGMAPPWELLK